MQNIFKKQWESAYSDVLLTKNIIQQLLLPYSSHEIRCFERISDGCANLNYKITFVGNYRPIILRVYRRDHQAIDIELGIYRLLGSLIPTPEFLHVDASCELINHPYAILNFIEGDLMRNVMMNCNESDLKQCAFIAGEVLAKLTSIKFEVSVLFQKDMQVKPFNDYETGEKFIKTLLDTEVVKNRLQNITINKLYKIIQNHRDLLLQENDPNLVHGDFDPSNILVNQLNGQWQIAAVLDWEFSFAGSYLFDMGTMLRFSHKLPSCFKQSFVQGVESGVNLPKSWAFSAKLMDLLCLLDLLSKDRNNERPRMQRDIIELIENVTRFFNY